LKCFEIKIILVITSQMKNSGKELRKPRYLYRLRGGNGIG
jgi:hypothetical protein